MVYGHTPSASTQTMPDAGITARDIKACNPSLPVAMGGIHPSALPERTLREEMIDFVIQGEGVRTVNALINCLKGKKALTDVPGLWYRKNGSIERTQAAPVVEDLDAALPGYAWDLLPGFDRYRAHTMHCFQDFAVSRKDDFSDVRTPYVSLNTSLGCPYSCHYCCINAIFGKPGIRYWSLERVLSWLDTLHQQGVRNIRFDDELFILSPRRVEQFCDMLIERNYHLNIWVYGRVDTIQPRLLRKLKQAGVNWICLGIEAGNAHVRNDVHKAINRDIGEVVRAIRAAGIYVLGNYMFGLPEDTPATMEETLELAVQLNCEFANFYTVMALPGSKLYDWALDQGHLPRHWSSFSQHSVDTQPLPTRFITADEVLSFRDNAFVRYFSNPDYVNMVQHVFGDKVRQHITEMLKIRIERRPLKKVHEEPQAGSGE